MRERRVKTLALSPAVFSLGLLAPHLFLLDALSGLGYFAVDLFGRWDANPLWVKEHGWLALFCDLGWPLSASFLLSHGFLYAFNEVKARLSTGTRLPAPALILELFYLVILAAWGQPGSLYVSFHNYWTTNY